MNNLIYSTSVNHGYGDTTITKYFLQDGKIIKEYFNIDIWGKKFGGRSKEISKEDFIEIIRKEEFSIMEQAVKEINNLEEIIKKI